MQQKRRKTYSAEPVRPFVLVVETERKVVDISLTTKHF